MLHCGVLGLRCDATYATQHGRVFLNGMNIWYFSPADNGIIIEEVLDAS